MDASPGPVPASGLRTDRLLVRPWAPGDLDACRDLYSRWEVVRYLGSAPAVVTTRRQAAERLARYARSAEHPLLYGIWAVTLRSGGAPVGTVLLQPLQLTGGQLADDIEVGWHLHPDHWGRGYATEAARTVLSRGFAAGRWAEQRRAEDGSSESDATATGGR